MLRACLAVAFLLASPDFARAQTQQGNAQAAGQLGRSRAGQLVLPLTNNTDFNGGEQGDGLQSELIFNPVIAFEASETLGFVSNTQLSLRYSENILERTTAGLGDIVQNTWLAPIPRRGSKVAWGVGTVLQVPTAAPGRLGQRQWGLGPSAFVSVDAKPVTFGVVINHPWAIAGDAGDRPPLDRLYLFPFANVSLSNKWTLNVNGDVSRNDETNKWATPLTVGLSRPVRIGGDEFVLSGGVRRFVGDEPSEAEFGIQIGLSYTFISEKGSR